MKVMVRMARVVTLVIMMGVIVMGVGGCSAGSEEAEQPSGTSPVEVTSTDVAALEGVTWKLFSWLDEDGIVRTPNEDGISATIEFGPDGMYFAQAPVNTMRGSYIAENNGTLVIEEGAMTRIAVDEVSRPAENAFIANLISTTGFEIADNMLRLLDNTGSPLMEFEK